VVLALAIFGNDLGQKPDQESTLSAAAAGWERISRPKSWHLRCSCRFCPGGSAFFRFAYNLISFSIDQWFSAPLGKMAKNSKALVNLLLLKNPAEVAACRRNIARRVLSARSVACQ